MLDKLKKHKVIGKGIFEKEYAFSSLTAAADVVTQGFMFQKKNTRLILMVKN